MNNKRRHILSAKQYEEILNRKKIGECAVKPHKRAQLETTHRIRLFKNTEEYADQIFRHVQAHGLTREERRVVDKLATFLIGASDTTPEHPLPRTKRKRKVRRS